MFCKEFASVHISATVISKSENQGELMCAHAHTDF